MMVRNTLSLKCSISCADTSLARLFRGSNMVRRMPPISSCGLGPALICSIVLDQRRQPLERVVLALHRDQHAVGRDQRIDRQHVQRRRTIDEHDVELLDGSAASASRSRDSQPGLPIISHFGRDQVLVGGHQFEIGVIDRRAAPRRRRCRRATHRSSSARTRALVDAAAHGRVALRIDVDQQHAPLRRRQRGGEIDARRRLADAAFLIGDGEDAMHCEMESSVVAASRCSREFSRQTLQAPWSIVATAADFHKMPLFVQTGHVKSMDRREFPSARQLLQLSLPDRAPSSPAVARRRHTDDRPI